MRVDNIFELVNKFSKQEDQISAGFGFILKNNPQILCNFLDKIKIKLTPKQLKKVDIETQASYDSGESRIDLQLTIYGEFLVFVESKLYKNEEKILEQLEKYKNILEIRRTEYANKIRLVYVNKQPMEEGIIRELRKKLKLLKAEFFFFSWEDLIKITDEYTKNETVKLFRNYIGDAMYAKKVINEQKIKDIVEVLVVYTNPAFWKLTEAEQIAVQRNSAPDAKYIAFLRTHREDGKSSAITHIAEVEYTESHRPIGVTYKNYPELIKHAKSRGNNLKGTHKHYVLGKIVKLSTEIAHVRGEGSRSQVYFLTKMSELLRAKSIGDIRTLKQLGG